MPKTLEYRFTEHNSMQVASVELTDDNRPADCLYDLLEIDEELAEEFELLIRESLANGDPVEDLRTDVVCGYSVTWRVTDHQPLTLQQIKDAAGDFQTCSRWAEVKAAFDGSVKQYRIVNIGSKYIRLMSGSGVIFSTHPANIRRAW